MVCFKLGPKVQVSVRMIMNRPGELRVRFDNEVLSLSTPGEHYLVCLLEFAVNFG